MHGEERRIGTHREERERDSSFKASKLTNSKQTRSVLPSVVQLISFSFPLLLCFFHLSRPPNSKVYSVLRTLL
jgi:hypothetical protein